MTFPYSSQAEALSRYEMLPMLRLGSMLVLAALATFVFGGTKSDAQPLVISCALTKGDKAYSGTCHIPCEVNAPRVKARRTEAGQACSAPRQVTASLTQASDGAWLGKMEGRNPEDPTRFEVTSPRNQSSGVAKTPYGWFRLREVVVGGEGALKLAISADKELPPTSDDIKIIERALSLLSSVDAWNRNDDRKCPPQQKTTEFVLRTHAGDN
jgi:hypothetical protein